MKQTKRLTKQRQRRKFRVRNGVRRSLSGRLRLCVFRSNKHIYAQIVDDEKGQTLVAASTRESAISASRKHGGNKDAASQVGKLLAERALEKDVKQVAFDRGPYRYHGRVAALADAARESGLSL